MDPPDKPLPRDSAGAFTLKGTDGGVTHMIGIGGLLTTFTNDAVFQVRTPESIDPERTHPDPPWTSEKILSVGSANAIIARVFIQFAEATKSTPTTLDDDGDGVITILWEVTKDLLNAEKQYRLLEPAYEQIVADIEGGKLEWEGKMINPFPRIEGLESAAEAFLLSFKGALQGLVRIYSAFYGASFSNPRFDRIIKHLKEHSPGSINLIGLLEQEHDALRGLVDLRNGIEHPTEEKHTVIKDFELTVNGINAPHWGPSDGKLSAILRDMPEMIKYMIWFSEQYLLLCLMDHVRSSWPYVATEIPEKERDPACPIRFRFGPGPAAIKPKNE